jgi:deferrochelatase/peroxidase EfeB
MSHSQPGIINRPPKHVLLAALTFTNRDTTGARVALDGLADVIRREVASDLDVRRADKTLPPPETGELGFDEGYDRAFLTITVGLSASAFDVLGVPADDRPQDLRPIPWGALGDSPVRTAESGDVIVQVCSDDLYVCEHVLRRIEEEHGDSLVTTWTQIGTQRYTTRTGRTSREEGRALIGFLDGTSNLNPRRSDEDAKLVFVDPRPEVIAGYPPNPQPDPGPTGPYATLPTGPRFPTDPPLAPVPSREPDWTNKGSYMTVRISTFDTRPWDKLSANDQETSVGRFKYSGASIDLNDDQDDLNADPAFAASQTDERVPFAAHVRKANPRRSDEDKMRRLFRRGYPIIASGNQQLERGLAFISFARTTSTQFEFIFRAWLRNADFPHQGAGPDRLLFGTLPETVHCGGYYFVPAVRAAARPWDWVLPG